jgi:5'-nucleotidase
VSGEKDSAFEEYKPLNILLTNDDGIHAEGLWALYDRLSARHEVAVVAPDRERSAVGHGITLQHPIRASRITVNGGYQGWSISGTPADCIKLAVVELLDQRPDLVISGINPGANVGVNLNYSGTVAAAKEATFYGIAALAVSVQVDKIPDYNLAADFIAHVVPMVSAKGLPPGIFLNINVPSSVPTGEPAEVRISRQGRTMYDEYFDKRQDPRNRIYYWQGSELEPRYRQSDSDGAVLQQKCISITPVRCDMTDYGALDEFRQWNFGNGFRAK